MAPKGNSNLKEIQRRSSNKDIALLAQEVGFLVERLEEFKYQTTQDFAEIKNNTSGMYATKVTTDDHEKRIARIERMTLYVLGFVFMAFLSALIGLVIVRP